MEQYVSIVSGSHTVELLFYSDDVALQCESPQMWCSETIVQCSCWLNSTVQYSTASLLRTDGALIALRCVFLGQTLWCLDRIVPFSNRQGKIVLVRAGPCLKSSNCRFYTFNNSDTRWSRHTHLPITVWLTTNTRCTHTHMHACIHTFYMPTHLEKEIGTGNYAFYIPTLFSGLTV